MTSNTLVHYIISGSGRKRRFRPTQQRYSKSDSLADMPGEFPSGLSVPIGAIFEPGRTTWKYPTSHINLSFGNGAIVGTARLVLLFWGQFWQTATNPSVQDIHQAADDILNSPYLSEVTQYGFKSLTLDPARIIFSPPPPSPTFSGDDVKNMVWDLIDDGVFPEPDDDSGNGRIVYMVFAPPETNYVGDAPAAGAHGEADDHDFVLLDADHAWVGWVDHDSKDGITTVFTHELVEILTDPEPHSGWTVDGFPPLDNEIVDVCYNQAGLVSGHLVAAYYSKGQNSCVVPSYPFNFNLAWDIKRQNVDKIHFVGLGETKATKGRNCFDGTYGWELFGVTRKTTITAITSGYDKPEFEWKVNDKTIYNATSAAVSSNASSTLDPLNLIEDVPPAQCTIKASANENVLVLEIAAGQPAADFDISCTVKENGLYPNYKSERNYSEAITLTGSFRIMDQRFQDDLDKCNRLEKIAAWKLIEEVVIPRIDKGDPPPPWVESALTGISVELQAQMREANFLEHFLSSVEPQLANRIRELAHGMLAVGMATEVRQVSQP